MSYRLDHGTLLGANHSLTLVAGQRAGPAEKFTPEAGRSAIVSRPSGARILPILKRQHAVSIVSFPFEGRTGVSAP